MSLSSGKDLTRGNAAWNLLNFTVPFLLAFFLQIFYGTVDVIAVGRFGGGSSDVSAVASGSEVMQLVASLIAGLTTRATVPRRKHSSRPSPMEPSVPGESYSFSATTRFPRFSVDWATPPRR